MQDLLACNPDQIEPIQMVKYEPGQLFGLHHDLGTLAEDGEVLLPRRNYFAPTKRRLMTALVYLDSLPGYYDGGETSFPQCEYLLQHEAPTNFSIKPMRGTLVLWSNITEEGLPEGKTVHEAKSACFRKLALNIWICEK